MPVDERLDASGLQGGCTQQVISRAKTVEAPKFRGADRGAGAAWRSQLCRNRYLSTRIMGAQEIQGPALKKFQAQAYLVELCTNQQISQTYSPHTLDGSQK